MEVGDVVRLKSGGPSMTIVSIDMVFARCAWFSDWDADRPNEVMLRLSCLRPGEPAVTLAPSYADDERLRTLREFHERRAAAEAEELAETRQFWAEQPRAKAEAELKAAVAAEEHAVLTGGDVAAAVQRRLRAEEVEARLSDEPGTF